MEKAANMKKIVNKNIPLPLSLLRKTSRNIKRQEKKNLSIMYNWTKISAVYLM